MESEERTLHLLILERQHAKLLAGQMVKAAKDSPLELSLKYPTQEHCPPGCRLSQQKEIIRCELLE